MSLSKAALNMAEALRPVLVKLIPQKMLSAVKAKVIEKGAKDLEKTEITPFEPQAHKKGINLIGSIKSDTGLGQSMRLVAEILENSTWDYTVYDYFVPPGGSRTNEAFDGKITQTDSESTAGAGCLTAWMWFYTFIYKIYIIRSFTFPLIRE